jgi:hypothetical protein
MILNEALKAKLTEKHSALRFAQDQMNEFITIVLQSNGIDLDKIEGVQYDAKEGTITFKEKENVG